MHEHAATSDRSGAFVLGCSATETALTALLGPTGVLPVPVVPVDPLMIAQLLVTVTLSPDSFAPTPFSPPPRA